MDQPQRHQIAPLQGGGRQGVEVGHGQQHEGAQCHLYQRQHLWRNALQALDDDRGNAVQRGRAQAQQQPRQIRAARRLRVRQAQHQQEAGECHHGPGQLAARRALTQKQHPQPDQEKRLYVVDGGGQRDGRQPIRGKQQHPVHDQRGAGHQRQGQRLRGEEAGLEQTARPAIEEQGQGAEDAAEEDDVPGALAGLQNKHA
ncbi:hypothetical protein D3C72_1359730 [compost metagenome]